MKTKFNKALSVITAIFLLSSFQCSAAGNNDPRLALRAEDTFTPYSENIYFSRYTPWIKSMALVSQTEKEQNIIGGDGDQQIRCLDISPVDNNLVVMGSDTSGVWITTNGGEFWYNTTANMDRTEIADVFCHPTDKNIILVYSYAHKSGISAPGIFRSENMGKSWECVYTDYINSSQVDELFAVDSSGNIYAAAGQGVIKSTDSGKTWQSLLASTDVDSESPDGTTYANSGSPRSIDITSGGKTIIACYAGTTKTLSGINVSTDGGATWTKKHIDEIDTGEVVYSCEIDPDNADRLIASGYSAAAQKYYLYISEDFGESWTAFKSASSGAGVLQHHKPISRIEFGGDYLYITFVNVSQGFRRLPVTEFASAATTQAWQVIDLKTPGATGFLAGENMYIPQGFDIEGDTLFACSTGPIKSTDGGNTWVRKSSGFNGALATHFYMDANGSMILSLTDGNIAVSQGNYTSSNTPTFERRGPWGGTLSTMALPDPGDSDHIICWNGNSNLHKDDIGIIVSYDGGVTYLNADGTNAYNSTTELYTNRVSDPVNYNTSILEYDTEDKDTVYASCATSKDNGETWTLNPYYILDICDADPNKMVAWDIYGDAPTYYLMYSDDRGKTWTQLVSAGSKLSDETEAFFDVADSNKIWYKTQFSFGTVDVSAKKKTGMTSKTPYTAYGTIAQNPKAPNHILLSSEELRGANCPSLYESLDYGETWHVVPGIFGMRTIRFMQFSTTTDEVFLGSHNGIIVYEYEKFNYYIGTILNHDGDKKYTTLDLYDDYVISPEEAFSVPEHKFNGWRYYGETYAPGERIYID